MKILAQIKTLSFYLLLIFLLVNCTILFFPGSSVLAAPGDPPSIAIISPAADTLLNDMKVIVSGTYTDDTVPLSGLLFTAYEKNNNGTFDKISDSGKNPRDWAIDNTNKLWTFSKKRNDGPNVLKIEIRESSTGTTANASVNFYISGTGIVLPDRTVQYGDDLTSVPRDAILKFTLTDDNPINQIDQNNAIKVMQGNTQITGTSTLLNLQVPGKNAYSITFTPSSGQFALNQTYAASLIPTYVGDATNKVFTKSFKFTTKTNAEWDDPDNPHGHYTLNTNMCANCHSTHAGSTSSLEGGSYQVPLTDELNKLQESSQDPSTNFCMACHDGTIKNAPIIDNRDKQYHHNNPIEYSASGANNLKQQESCTSCHNPHLEWSESNPNLLKDHYVYTHNPEDKNLRGLTALKVDSLDTSCDTCHEKYNTHDSTTYADKSIFDTETFRNGFYEYLQYKKSLTTNGSIDDYSLCLRCHTKIKTYYQQTTSTHLIAAQDGSKLNGLLPCAECHETHGSNNSFLLKSSFGHESPDRTAFSITGGISSFTPDKERLYCQKCHNGTTKLYGVVGQFDKTISGHTDSDTDKACSSCHSSSGLLIEAAHAPKAAPNTNSSPAPSTPVSIDQRATTTVTP